MRYLTLPVTVSLAFAALAGWSCPNEARAQNVPTFTKEVVASRVWTNEDMDQLRAEAQISTFGPAPQAAAQPVQQAQVSQPSFTPRPIRVQDPAWYAQQAAMLQAELDNRESALRQYVQAIADAKSRQSMASGIALDKDSIGVTPEGGTEVLQARINEIQSQLDDLADLARENDIPPGTLRG